MREFLALPGEETATSEHGFRLRVPREFAALIDKGAPRDPLLRQVWPLTDEGRAQPGFSADPVGDRAARRAPGVLRKYHGRALLMLTSACPIHCRYCFRRNYPHDAPLLTARAMEEALMAIRGDASISEVILSGGDPLMADDERLAALIARLDAIPQLRRLRIHSRMPLVIPARVTEELAALLQRSRLPATLVLHANHARELAPGVAAPLARLRSAGITLLNQSVLLRGVNDDGDALTALSERLFEHGVLPYYLHLLDRVAGAAHFEVEEAQARQLVADMRRRLPGYLVPRLVREIPGQASKTPI